MLVFAKHKLLMAYTVSHQACLNGNPATKWTLTHPKNKLPEFAVYYASKAHNSIMTSKSVAPASSKRFNRSAMSGFYRYIAPTPPALLLQSHENNRVTLTKPCKNP